MPSTLPLVSIIIPAYNTGKYILETLENALAIRWENKEIIVVDDGSTDDTAERIKPLMGKISYLYQANKGLSGARNTGIRGAKGEYLVFLDADDLVDPDFLQVQIPFLEYRPHVDISYCWWSYIDDQGQRLPEIGRYQESGNLLKDLVLFNRFPVMSAVVRRRVIDQIGVFDESNRAGEDWDFWLRAAAAGMTYENIPVPLVYYRIHGSNMSLNMRWLQVIDNVLTKYFQANNPPAEIQALKPAAYARAYINFASAQYRVGKPEEAVQTFIQGVQIWPELLVQENTYYALICAHQPPGYRDTSYYKDLDEALARINALLDVVFRQLADDPKIAGLKKKALAVKELTFARHEYQEGNTLAARQRIYTAARNAPREVLNPPTLRLLARAMLGQEQVNRVKKALGRAGS